jgi:hypothetical protein
LFSQMQLYVSVSGSQSFWTVVMLVMPGCCRQMSGHWALWLPHQASVGCQVGGSVDGRSGHIPRSDEETLLGSIV